MTDKLAALLFDTWDDLDRVYEGLSPEDALRSDAGSSFAWTYAHLANTIDAWLNVRFQKLDSHPLIGQQRFRFGGSGEAGVWREVRHAVAEVHASARPYLERLTEADLNTVYPYDGSLLHLRETGITLRFALSRFITHHYFHIGEVAAKRERLGHSVGDYPGRMAYSL